MANTYARLRHGNRILSLNSAGIELIHFVPPTAAEELGLSAGSPVDRYQGGSVVSVQGRSFEFAFDIRILGDTTEDIDAKVNAISTLLSLSDDKSEHLYFEWKSSSAYDFEPIWGTYGAYRRMIVEFGALFLDSTYEVKGLRESGIKATIRLFVQPYITCAPQRLFMASNCQVIQDLYGVRVGMPRGLTILDDGRTNKITNPVFNSLTPSSWNSGWNTSDPTLFAEPNVNPEFVLFGVFSARLVNRNVTSNLTFYQDVNVGNTNTHWLSFYVKKADGSAVTSADCQAFYAGSGIATTFYNIGNGWYRAVASFAGQAASKRCGVSVKAGKEVYVDGFLLEEGSAPTQLIYGDMLGCSWNATPYGSSSLRPSIGFFHLSFANPFTSLGPQINSFPLNNATFLFAIEFNQNKDFLVSGQYDIMQVVVTPNMRLSAIIGSTSVTIRFDDGTSQLTSTSIASTFNAGQKYIIHLVYDQDRNRKIYVDGQLVASDANYDPPDAGSTVILDIGDSEPITYLGLSIFDRALSAAQVAEDYQACKTIIDTQGYLADIPWAYFPTNSNSVDNRLDSSGKNYFIIGGIPGETAADTIFYLDSGVGVAKTIFITEVELPPPEAPDPQKYLFFDQIGVADTNANGGARRDTSVGTTYTALLATSTAEGINSYYMRYFTGSEVYALVRLINSVAGNIGLKLELSDGNTLQSQEVFYASSSSAYRTFLTAPIDLPNANASLNEFLSYSRYTIDSRQVQLRGKNTSGTTTIGVDYLALLPRPLWRAKFTSASLTNCIVHSNRAIVTNDNTFSTVTEVRIADGDRLQVTPGKYALFMFFFGDEGTDNVLSDSFVVRAVVCLPHWRVL